ncbi:MAG: glycine cleavage system aminomethyltransferase GcvT [Candidatus Bathyarchaeota archaeon]|nr:glycine cleavage system aminomethyltransferase GcvT [Candidatus Bathyarchaeota archaeon]
MRRTQLYEFHRRTANMTNFAGFEMPLWYKGITEEHLAVRNNVGVFDVSHMGRVVITGKDAEAFLNYVITNDVATLTENSALYTVMCNEAGGIVDDCVVSRIAKDKFLLVPNAANREKDYNWLVKHVRGYDVKVEDLSNVSAMLAIQGPKAEETLQKICPEDLSKIERFQCVSTRLVNVDVFVSRTGYTGEDGFEVYVWNTSVEKPDNAVKVWNAVLEAGEPLGIEPCGLGARDTLRLEAGLCLYGSDIDENTTPLEARLGFVVKFQKDKFIGKNALLKQKEEGIKRRRVGLQIIGQGIPRQGFRIYDDKGENIGQITSGTFSPLLKCGIAMAYVQTQYAQEGTLVNVEIRGKKAKAKIVAFPFYDVEKYGYKRKTSV